MKALEVVRFVVVAALLVPAVVLMVAAGFVANLGQCDKTDRDKNG